MSEDKHSTLPPETQALVNSMISSAIAETLKGMAPIFQSIALTPEKMLEMERQRRAPDPAQAARDARERKLMQEDLRAAEQRKREIQSSCPHKDSNMKWCISLIHNYPDRQPRLICLHCHLMMEPKHWEILAPTPEYPRGKEHLAEAHPQYGRILAEVMQQNQTA